MIPHSDYPAHLWVRRPKLKCLDVVWNSRGEAVGEVTRISRIDGEIVELELDHLVLYQRYDHRKTAFRQWGWRSE